MKSTDIIPLNEGQLDQLLTTNKSLAVQKRELHRQKLRNYSEKAVKLRALLRECTDPQQKKCFESKLKSLQQKQDAQITKLAKIDQIQKEIDQFMTEQSEPQKLISETYFDSNQQWRCKNQSTPAQRLRTKSSMPHKKQKGTISNSEFKDFSRKQSRFTHKNENQFQLLKDSRFVLEQLSSNNIEREKNQKRSKQSKNSVNRNDTNGHFSSYKKSECNLLQNSIKYQETRCYFQQQPLLEHIKQQFESVPSIFITFVEKVKKFWPKDIEQLLKYFKQCQFMRKKMSQKQKEFDNLLTRQEKVKSDQTRLRKQQQKLKKQQQKLNQSFEKQRRLLQNIDMLHQQFKLIKKQVESSMQAITKSADIISQATSALSQRRDPVEVNCFHSEAVHKFSVDSFEFAGAESTNLSRELTNFQNKLQQYLLSAQRSVMLVSGQLQQVTLRLGKTKQEHLQLQNKKRTLQQQINKIDCSLSGRRALLKELQSGLSSLQSSVSEHSSTAELKRALSQQLQQKCQKMKLKKKAMSQRVKRMEEELESLNQRRDSLYGELEQCERKLATLHVYEKELQTKLIFCQRDKENRVRDVQQLQKKEEQAINRVQQINRSLEHSALKASQQQMQLAQINASIQIKKDQELLMGERARKMQLQLTETSSFLQQQRKMSQQLAQQVSQRSTEHLQLQTKLSQLLTMINERESELTQSFQKIVSQKKQIQQGHQQLQQIKRVKLDLQSILHEVMIKKQVLLTQVSEHSKELQLLISEIETGQEEHKNLMQDNKELFQEIKSKHNQIKNLQNQIQQLRNQLDEEIEEEVNINARLSKLRSTQKTILLQMGVKGASSYLEGQLKIRVAQAVAELAFLNDIKSQLKQCKYENRKLKLDNQRLSQLLQEMEA